MTKEVGGENKSSQAKTCLSLSVSHPEKLESNMRQGLALAGYLRPAGEHRHDEVLGTDVDEHVGHGPPYEHRQIERKREIETERKFGKRFGDVTFLLLRGSAPFAALLKFVSLQFSEGPDRLPHFQFQCFDVSIFQGFMTRTRKSAGCAAGAN
ncbi:hypothetical protein H6P81_001884 [Aristolochia fimbriata]|uniref:Uncharacterized protein n=1 Tax=Aristolochia fimbriata TaxID=158543 RepID=A0AAV7FBD5_ARIFI|nr:hypothetical protein H6P81_001884 [Aristolochia fimbriata]